MDIVDVIRQRKSIRAFKPDPVPRETLKEIMDLALRAPSWANTQAWEFAMVGGKKIEEIRQAFTRRAEAGAPMNPDIPAPPGFPDPYGSRRRSLGMKLIEIMGIQREDQEKRRQFSIKGIRLFEAPHVIYIYTDRALCFPDGRLNAWPVFDCGLVAENIMLLAAGHGLGTIAQAQAVAHPDLLRKILEIPESKIFVIGISIGVPDWDAPENSLVSDRAPLEEVAGWYGFE